jgi:2-phospho-L-lactate guanylyltransferase
MATWAIIPVRASPDSKSRLAGVLDAGARALLVEAMLARVLDAARGARNIDRLAVIGTPPHGLPADVDLLSDAGRGLNAAAASALAEIGASGAQRIVVIHADLPQVTPLDLELLAAAPVGEIAIAPDRHGTGTNALSLPFPGATGFSFAFGAGSFTRHVTEADRLGLKLGVIRSPGLARDVDEPADLADAAELLKTA